MHKIRGSDFGFMYLADFGVDRLGQQDRVDELVELALAQPPNDGLRLAKRRIAAALDRLEHAIGESEVLLAWEEAHRNSISVKGNWPLNDDTIKSEHTSGSLTASEIFST